MTEAPNRVPILLTVLTAVVLFFIFWVMGLLAPLAALVILPFYSSYSANIVHSMDMLAAALLGWDGRSTISKECGRDLNKDDPCRFCRVVCTVLNVLLESDHCKKEAARN